MSDYIRKMLEQDREIRRLLNPLETAAAGLHPHDRIVAQASASLDLCRLLDERADLEARAMGFLSAEQYRSVAFDLAQRTATETFVEEFIRAESAVARAAIGLDANALADLASQASRAQAIWEASFRLPQVSELEALLVREVNTASDWAGQFSEATRRADFLAAASTMREPWLNETETHRSLAGFAEMQAIGATLRSASPFDVAVANTLRHSFGDWRESEFNDMGTILDPVARTALYYEHGFNPDITAFPRPAFIEGLRQAGLELVDGEVAQENTSATGEGEADDEDVEGAFARNRAAFDQLQRFEVAMRQFLDRILTDAFGANWISTCVPSEMADHWRTKQDADRRANGTTKPLIEYADFSDYRAIIERKANWTRAFRPVFKRQTDIQESFQRLYPVRIATMHARMITQDDEMLLTVETRRILKAIRTND